MFRILCVACILHAIFVTWVSGQSVQMTFDPSPVVSSTPTARMTCRLTDSTNIKTFLYINIARNASRDLGNVKMTPVASMVVGGNAELEEQEQDVVDRKPTVTGTMTNNDVAELIVAWDQTDITKRLTCHDRGEYVCTVGYMPNSGLPDAVSATANLDVQNSLPKNLVMQVKRPSNNQGGFLNPQFTPVQPTETLRFSEQDAPVEMQCSADIGEDRSVKIEWREISTSDPEGELIKYSSKPEDHKDDGTPSDTLTDCSYRLTSTLKYNFTIIDVRRGQDNIPLRFNCKIVAQGVTIQSNILRIIVVGSQKPDTDKSVSSAGAGSAGIIAGAVIGALVFIVLVVLLVYFLWYRRRGDGDTYRTKEDSGPENPNMAPNAVEYASPHKDRNRGFQNEALDEPHEDRSRKRNDHRDRGDRDRHRDDRYRDDRYRDDRDRGDKGGRANYGMDDDNYSNGSVSMDAHVNHMGADPQENFGTGV